MDSSTKKRIINSSKDEFMHFLDQDNTKQILELLDKEGIAYLKKSDNPEGYFGPKERMYYIFGRSKYVNELFLNQDFLDLFLNMYLDYFKCSLGYLNKNTYDLILKRCVELKKDLSFTSKLIDQFGKSYQVELIKNWKYPGELLYEVFKNCENLAPEILKKFDIDLLSHDIDINRVISNGKRLYDWNLHAKSRNQEPIETMYLSSKMLNKKVAEKLWEENTLYAYRKIINEATYSGNPEILNEYAKEKEEEIIAGNVVPKPYDTLKQFIDAFKTSDSYEDVFFDFVEKMYHEWSKLIDEKDAENIIGLIKEHNLKEAESLIDQKIEEVKSDCIIDYHFEEISFNILTDLNELLEFYYAGNIQIPDDRLDLYQKILHIDELSDEDKIELHSTLKNHNMIEDFYDDMAFARKIVRDAIKDYALTKDELADFRDDKLSEEYGVDVYNIEDNPFFAIVKSGRHPDEYMPSGHSYSLIGNGCIATFVAPEENTTFVYDAEDLDSDQIMHVFPDDSFTSPRSFGSAEISTRRVEQLMMPDELTYETPHYNELLILEQGKTPTDLDKKIPKLKRMALYCRDQITEDAVKTAQINGVGIVLINTKNYNKGIEMPASVYRHLGKNTYFDYNYDGSSRDVRERRR